MEDPVLAKNPLLHTYYKRQGLERLHSIFLEVFVGTVVLSTLSSFHQVLFWVLLNVSVLKSVLLTLLLAFKTCLMFHTYKLYPQHIGCDICG